MITVPASITIPEEDFENFVMRLGYQEQVEDPNDNTQMVANPETKLEYAQHVFKESVVLPWLLQFKNNDIDVAVNNAREEERATKKQAAYDALSPAVTIG